MIRLSRGIVGEEEAFAVKQVLLEDGYLGMGKETGAFEEELAQFIGVERHKVICVNSGTAALHLACEALLGPGDEVLVQSLTFVAAFQAIKAVGAVPVACEVHEKDLSIDLKDAESKITSRTKVIMAMHYGGYPANWGEIYAFAKRHNLRVIEDAAHAFGSTIEGKKVGSEGDIVCFSFDGIKNITSGEGGALVVHNKYEINNIKDARLLGVHNDSEKRFAGLRSWDFDVKVQGYRYHMSNVLAAIGRVQLKKMPRLAEKRHELTVSYVKSLQNLPQIGLFEHLAFESVVPHLFPIRVMKGKRNALKEFLFQQKIETGIHYKPNHLHSFFWSGASISLPKTEKLYEELLSLPLHPGLTHSDVSMVCKHIELFMKETVY